MIQILQTDFHFFKYCRSELYIRLSFITASCCTSSISHSTKSFNNFPFLFFFFAIVLLLFLNCILKHALEKSITSQFKWKVCDMVSRLTTVPTDTFLLVATGDFLKNEWGQVGYQGFCPKGLLIGHYRSAWISRCLKSPFSSSFHQNMRL